MQKSGPNLPELGWLIVKYNITFDIKFVSPKREDERIHNEFYSAAIGYSAFLAIFPLLVCVGTIYDRFSKKGREMRKQRDLERDRREDIDEHEDREGTTTSAIQPSNTYETQERLSTAQDTFGKIICRNNL